MPKLNVQQNNQNVIQAFKNALAIGNLKGIIASDGNHNFSAAGSNPNLLDNPWFTVNQRGVNGTITNGQYGLDRWMACGGTVTMATGGIILGAGNSYAMQRPADPSIFNGKTVTMSVMTSDGTIESGTTVAQTGSAKTVRTANFELCIGYTAYNSFYFYNTSSSAKTVIAAKLELGSVSTLANDAPPNYAEELAKCNFYDTMLKTSAQYGYLGYGIADSATSATILIPLPNNMRDATPTITTNGTISVKGGTSGTHTMTGITFKLRVTGGVLVTVATVGLTTGEFCLLQLNNTSSYINLSADL